MRLDLRIILEKDSVALYDHRFTITGDECCDRVINEALAALITKCREAIATSIH